MLDTLSNSSTLFKSIRKWILFLIAIIILTYLIVNTVSGAYTVLTECWVCEVVENIYDAFSRVSYETFDMFQNDALVLLSVALALWIVYETYNIFFVKGISGNFGINITPDYFKMIYKKLFLATFVIGAFLLNSPRNVFSNTYEIVLDFGSGIGRSVLHKKIDQLGLSVPDECKNQSTDLVYKEGMALSENTKDNMVCLIKETDILRKNYMEIGINLFEYGLPSLIVTAVINVSIRVVGFITGKTLQKVGSEKWVKGIQKKIDKIQKKIDKSSDKKKKDRWKKLIDDLMEDIENPDSQKVKRQQHAGRFISNNADKFANVSSIVAIIANDSVKMGLTGIVLVIGLFMVNMLFAFIIIENMLFMGVSLLIFPFLAICYVFNETRSYATAGLKKLWSFAKGLIFVCIAIIICNEVNDWVLGGMFSTPGESNISTTKHALKLLQAGEIDKFNELVGSPFYFFYALFAIIVNFKIISEAPKFAGWFTGSVSQSELGKSVWNFSKSVVKWSTSIGRELKTYNKKQYKAPEIFKKDKDAPSSETKDDTSTPQPEAEEKAQTE